jgi:succinate dehydrogenase / fumarate reductase cytochrome b subunit
VKEQEAMIPLKEALSSSVGKKYLMAGSGLAMVGFVVTHLLGNLQLYLPTGDKFNVYAHGLASLGPLLWVAEIGLLGVLALHVVIAVGLTLQNKAARPGYKAGFASKGGPSYASPASRNMIISGVVLLGFLGLHIAQMKFGLLDGDAAPGQVTVEGVQMFDLYSRVVAQFQNPLWVGVYVAVMLFLGAHLRHGFWSAFQSLGALNARLERPAVALGLATAVLLAAGFLFIPIFIFVTK